jgi:Cd2+/Zn2+-exporting ATPase
VNDAPALAAGDLGIAMGAAGSEVAIKSASIALLNSDLRRLPFLLHLSRRARVAIGQNFVVGLCFIVGGLVLAMLGKINPVVAAILHNAGSLLVVFNSARLVREGEELDTFRAPEEPAAPSLSGFTGHPAATAAMQPAG